MTRRGLILSPVDAQLRILELESRIAKLEKINTVLIERVERSLDSQGSAFSLFQTAIGLERQVRLRTDELTRTLRRLEQMNDQLILAKDIAERANKSKTRFLAQAGHDLLQPLNAAELAISALSEMQSDEDGRRLARQVERALATIEGLLKTLLDISKLDAGITLPQVTSVSLGQLLADLAADFAPVAARRDLRLTVLPSSEHVLTDPIMLTRILQNLIGNALRYTEKGRVLVGTRRRQSMVRIDVVDTGPGIAVDQHALIFEEFHRGKGLAHDGEIGLGLGLSIVQRLVGALGHQISLNSHLGHGTRFSIELPRADGPLASLPAKVEDRPSQGWGLSGALVAVVDNDPAVREATVDLIRRWRCETVQAGTSKALIDAVSTLGRRPDLLLVDYHLDVETGLEALERFRAHVGSAVPAIVITADYTAETEERVTAAGFEVLKKPVKPAELRALMAHLLE
ncbi:MAG: hybrid sensor histidine kinase/response regulator [Ancalomicrobiaceae bacterium]|nr:hybrid sensor histidine kinase/response regulator [Ancalomicrobiaceae bacterium]